MRYFKSKLAMFAVLAGLQAIAHASLLDPDEYVGAGHTWLKLGETDGLSINDILSGAGGWNTKYRFATVDEVQGLLASLGFAPHDYTRDASPSLLFFSQLGGSDRETGMNGTWFADGNAGAIGRTLGARVSVDVTNGDAGYALSQDCPAYFVCNSAQVSYAAQDPFYADTSAGNLLVRLPDQGTVPEPSSLALFGLAALCMTSWRRARR